MTNIKATTRFTYGTMSESRLEKAVMRWIGATDNVPVNMRFYIQWKFNEQGVAVGASVRVVRGNVLCGEYNPFGSLSLQYIIDHSTCSESSSDSGEELKTKPLTYFEDDYIEDDYFEVL